ncbi:MAG TPA: tetratricopeptide repeat protein [Thermoanaerobaculia bacterium]|nr:tetratricopeptide repeat protein [Thermoanaerobaculia bacterium]
MRGRWRAPCLALLALLGLPLAGGAPPLAAQAPVDATEIEIGPAVGQSLLRLQDLWLQWVTAFYQGRRDGAEAAVVEMERIASQLGMRHLPDLARAMAAKAVDGAAEGDRERALWALDMAERLHPGRPEIALARARVASATGAPLEAARWELDGWRRLAVDSSSRPLLGRALLGWTTALLLLAAGLYLLLQFAVKGPTVYRDLHALFARRLSGLAAHLAALVALAWPLALPGGLLWWLLWASALLWAHASTSERWVQAAIWIVAGTLPILAAQQQPHGVISLSPPVRAMEALAEGRLEGSLLTDLGVLRSTLPKSVAVQQLVADVHRRFGQWEFARSLYRQVLEAAPESVDVLLDLGAFHFRQGEFATATGYFQRAATADPGSAAAYYNLSLSYSEAYLFEESRQALEKARRLDGDGVAEWVRSGEPRRVLTFDGGLARAGEIRQELAAVWGRSPALGRADWLPLAATLAFALVALVWDRALRRLGGGPPVSLATHRPAWAEWAIALGLPAWRAAEEGAGWRTFAGVAGPLALLLLPFVGRLAVMPPAALAVSGRVLGWISVLGLTALLGVRAWRERRRVG